MPVYSFIPAVPVPAVLALADALCSQPLRRLGRLNGVVGKEALVTADGFREFAESSYRSLLQTAYLLTGSNHAAEDLVQSALLDLMPRFEQIAQPLAYARRTM